MNEEKTFLVQLREHYGILHKITCIYAEDAHDREDLAQEIQYQLWKSYAGFRGECRFSTWMYRIALNTALGRIRRRRVPLLYPRKLPDPPSEPPDDERVAQLFAALRRLPRSDRAVIALHLEDLTLAEIASVLGITPTHAGVKIHRAKNKLKTLLNP